MRMRSRMLGMFIATAAIGAVISSPVARAQVTFEVIAEFGFDRGAYPMTGLVQGSDGALYGTTVGDRFAGPGTVFRILPGVAFRVLHNFVGGSMDGEGPNTALLEGSDGALYGTTSGGGSSNLGTVFRMLPDGTGFTLLHAFDGEDGNYPTALLEGSDGALYGTTWRGGPTDVGTVFQMLSDGTGYALLHGFSRYDDGGYPSALVQGSDGALYGTTVSTGIDHGTVFQVLPDGTGFTVLHRFTGNDGRSPQCLLQGRDGALYGTTRSGGAPDNAGTVFQLLSDGSGYGVLHAFHYRDGWYPNGGLIQGKDGALYGTTERGGYILDYGTAFRITIRP